MLSLERNEVIMRNLFGRDQNNLDILNKLLLFCANRKSMIKAEEGVTDRPHIEATFFKYMKRLVDIAILNVCISFCNCNWEA